MSDLKMIITSEGFDLSHAGLDFEKDDGLQTAVLISLFSDARVTDDELPHGQSSKRGWWGDLTQDSNIGSKLWILGRQKITKETPKRISELAEESLKWLVTEKVAKSVTATAERVGTYEITLSINISRPNNTDTKYNFEWNTMGAINGL